MIKTIYFTIFLYPYWISIIWSYSADHNDHIPGITPTKMSQTNCSLLLEIDSVIRKSLLVKPKADLKLFSLFIFIASWKAKYIYILGSGQFSVRFSHLKLRFFGFGVLPGLRIFSNLVFGFRFLSTMMTVFRIFSTVQCILRKFFLFFQGSYTVQ